MSSTGSNMRAYRTYVTRVEARVLHALRSDRCCLKEEFAGLLNGDPTAELRKAIDLSARRAAGLFFTGRQTARMAIRSWPMRASSVRVVFDPACGAGDLLLAVARRLPVLESLVATLDLWGERLRGVDQHQEFVQLAKARLVALALCRGSDAGRDSVHLKTLFRHIECADGLRNSKHYGAADWIILNPPYHQVSASEDCEWATGKITCAARFYWAALLNANCGTHITAILPDVLRTGSRYSKWRKMIESYAAIDSVRLLGVFDDRTDIHVFILNVVKRKSSKEATGRWWIDKHKQAALTVGALYDVHVGSVVPHRDPKRGPLCSYIHARSVPAWGRVDKAKETRRFAGAVFESPFVAIRRTSRPEDQFRAVGTLVSGKEQMAVENHLIVCRPKDGTIRSCKLLLDLLRNTATNSFLNKRIRCRHLTVAAIRELPCVGLPDPDHRARRTSASS